MNYMYVFLHNINHGMHKLYNADFLNLIYDQKHFGIKKRCTQLSYKKSSFGVKLFLNPELLAWLAQMIGPWDGGYSFAV